MWSPCGRARPLVATEDPHHRGPAITITKEEVSECSGSSTPLYAVRLSHTNAADTRDEHMFDFDHAFGPNSSQEEVYTEAVKPQVGQVLQGARCCVLAYGATGSGKTYTMLGGGSGNRTDEGIVMRSLSHEGLPTRKALVTFCLYPRVSANTVSPASSRVARDMFSGACVSNQDPNGAEERDAAENNSSEVHR